MSIASTVPLRPGAAPSEAKPTSASPSGSASSDTPATTASVTSLAAHRMTARDGGTEKRIHASGGRTAASQATQRGGSATASQTIPRRDSLAHGLYATALAPAAKLLGEDPACFAALCDALVVQYDPQDIYEEFQVERLALLWWRIDRLRNASLMCLHAALDEGEAPVTALLKVERIAVAEARLERAISYIHKDLRFLARHRPARKRR